MNSSKFIRLYWFPALLAAIVITGFLTNENIANNENRFGVRQPEGTIEFYYRPAGDRRVWHVINNYTNALAKDSSGYNVSEYLFTSDTVTVRSRIVGIDLNNIIGEFAELNKQLEF